MIVGMLACDLRTQKKGKRVNKIRSYAPLPDRPAPRRLAAQSKAGPGAMAAGESNAERVLSKMPD